MARTLPDLVFSVLKERGTKMQDVPPAKCQALPLEGPLEGRTLVEVAMLEGIPECRAAKAEAIDACYKKIGDRTIRGPWRFEFEVPNRVGDAPPADPPPRETPEPFWRRWFGKEADGAGGDA